MKIIPYENTLYSLMLDSIKGKYFQNILNPKIIIHIPEENKLELNLIKNECLSVWMLFIGEKGYFGHIFLSDFSNYAEISDKQFRAYEKDKCNLSEILLAHKNSEAFKEYNKANLSAQNSQSQNQKNENSIKNQI